MLPSRFSARSAFCGLLPPPFGGRLLRLFRGGFPRRLHRPPKRLLCGLRLLRRPPSSPKASTSTGCTSSRDSAVPRRLHLNRLYLLQRLPVVPEGSTSTGCTSLQRLRRPRSPSSAGCTSAGGFGRLRRIRWSGRRRWFPAADLPPCRCCGSGRTAPWTAARLPGCLPPAHLSGGNPRGVPPHAFTARHIAQDHDGGPASAFGQLIAHQLHIGRLHRRIGGLRCRPPGLGSL